MTSLSESPYLIIVSELSLSFTCGFNILTAANYKFCTAAANYKFCTAVRTVTKLGSYEHPAS